MCTNGDGVPGDVAEALRSISTTLDYLNGPAGVAVVEAAGQGDVLAALARVTAQLAAARATALSRFDAGRGHDADGYGSSASWLAATNRVTRKAAAADVRRMRQLRRHPRIAQALAAGEISESWAAEMAEWTRKLPAELREGVDKLLVDTAAAGANLEDLAFVAHAAYERWWQQSGADNDPDDGFDDRYLKLGTTIDNAGRVNGNLTPECTTALQAVLDALGKKAGAEDHRTEPQRFHDALQLACELLIRAQMVPDRAGADTRVDVVIALSQLRDMPGAPAMENTWLAAMAAPWRTATSIICGTRATADPHQLPIAPPCANSTTTFASTGGTGDSPFIQTGPPPRSARGGKCCTATGHPVAVDHRAAARPAITGRQAPRRHDPPPGTPTEQESARDRVLARPVAGLSLPGTTTQRPASRRVSLECRTRLLGSQARATHRRRAPLGGARGQGDI
jgi:hypothetical protein